MTGIPIRAKTCTLRVNPAQDGTLLSVKSEGGDPAFCQQMLAATNRMTKFPKPPSQAIYETFKKMRHWTLNHK